MQRRSYQTNDMQRVLVGMITDPVVCSRISSQWRDGGLFHSKPADLVGSWCIKHFRQYGQPPNGQMRSIFERWAEGNPNNDEKTISFIEGLLSWLSDNAEELSSDYLLDVAGRIFNKARIRQVLEEVETDLEVNEVDDAYSKLINLGRVELGVGSVIKPAEDYDAWREAFEREEESPLIGYRGKLDDMLGVEMRRGKFLAFMGPDKVGKSMWLLDVAYRAVRNRRRVAFFDTGDMTRHDVMMRLGERTTRTPRRGKKVQVPAGWVDGKLVCKTKVIEEPLTPSGAFKAFRRISRQGKDLLRISCHPNSSLDVHGLESIIWNWEREGWVPDIVIVDYADIMAPPKGVSDSLEQIDMTWRLFRRMSQELDCLLVTATQSNAAAYSKKGGMLTRAHFAGRKTKLAHVNGMVGLNQNDDEKQLGVTRINWVVRREGAWSSNRYVRAAGCFEIASPAIVSG